MLQCSGISGPRSDTRVSKGEINGHRHRADPGHLRRSTRSIRAPRSPSSTWSSRPSAAASRSSTRRSTDGKLVGTVDVGSIVVKDENLAAHLQSPEFFDAERYPELRFESTDIRRTGEGDEVVVDGELTIKGITKSVEARGTLEGPAVTFGDVNKVGLTLEAIIDRTEFGLNWNAPLPKGGFALANDVKLIVELELAEQA